MTSAAKPSSAVAGRYARALIDLATEGQALERVESDLAALQSMINNSPELALLIRSPLVNRMKCKAGLMEIAARAKFHALTSNFLGVLCENRRLPALEAIIAAFGAELSRRRGEIAVNVQTAQDMSPAQLKSLEQAIAKGLEKDVSVRASVKPSILGGMIVTVGSQMIDDSVARKLERLKAAMSRQSNQNPTSIEKVG